jgi:formylglycine-generating enzyme
MRLVRPLKPMSDEDKKRVWEIDDEELAADVKARLDEGRGAVGVASPTLPEAVKAAEKLGEGS